MTATVPASESQPSVQEEIFKTLLRTPHRSVDEFLTIHSEQMKRDPFLYGCLATYAVHEGECAVRDIQDVFVATLFTSEFPEHREAAWVMLQDLPPYRARRVIQYITGFAEVVTRTSLDPAMPRQGQFGVSHERARYSKNHSDRSLRGKPIPSKRRKLGRKLQRRLKTTAREITVDQYLVKHAALGKSMSRVLRSGIEQYLRFREENETMMEGAILRARDALRYLYAKAHLVPGGSDSSWINRCVFHNEAPEGSRIEAMKNLIASNDPTEQAEIIMAAKLPYPVVRSLVKTITPSVLVALIDSMSPQELLANLASIKREGAFESSEIKELVQNKIKDVRKAKKGKVDALKGETATEAVADLDAETRALVSEATDAQMKKHGQIGATTALLIDKSMSMQGAIELGKKVAAAIAQAGGDKFKACYLFGTDARRVQWTEADGDITSYSAWAEKLKMQLAGGATKMGLCLRAMMRANIDVEQIVLITDQGDNGTPRFTALLPEYEEQFGHMPTIVIIWMGQYRSDQVERGAKHKGAEVDVVDVTNIDRVSIPNLIQLLSRKSLFDLVQEILELPLPTKKGWLDKQAMLKARAQQRKTADSKTTKTKKSKTSGQPATVG